MNKAADEKQRKLYTHFPSTHFLSNPNNVDHVLLWNTMFRRNLHKLAIDYLGIKLHLYQAFILYFMGICRLVVIVACRAAAKSFIIALYACCRCITRPGTKFVISSATKGQSKLIVSEKIKNELMRWSPALSREIKSVKDNQNEVIVFFYNGSTITVVPASENGRGYRSTACCREEFRQIDKKIDDSILSPFGVIRMCPYMLEHPYSDMKDLQEDPVDIYISSSWIDTGGHWMWPFVDNTYKDMMSGEDVCLLAFDESVTLKHNIKTMRQLQQEKKKQDPLTWRIEFLNERVKENVNAFFTYDMIAKNQILRKMWYPRLAEDVRQRKKNRFEIPKQPGEVRVVACDMAFVQNKNNDNSVFSCIRALPEISTYSKEDGSGDVVVKQGYHKYVPHIESVQGGDTGKQAIRIRQLYEDFEADYIVLDIRNGGIAVFDLLAKTMYDAERDVEYPPLTCSNDESIANRIKIEGAKPVIFAVSASQRMNSDIAFLTRDALVNGRIDFLVNFNTAVEEVLPNIKEYIQTNDTNLQFFYEKPFLETQMLISEMMALNYEKLEQTGMIKIFEQGNARKDRYTSVSYGLYFLSLLEQDLLSDSDDEIDYMSAPMCVTQLSI